MGNSKIDHNQSPQLLGMETQPLANIDGYRLFIQHFSHNYYQINICDPNDEVHQFEGVYSSPEAAIARGQEVIKSFQFWRKKKSTPAISEPTD